MKMLSISMRFQIPNFSKPAAVKKVIAPSFFVRMRKSNVICEAGLDKKKKNVLLVLLLAAM